ncbi:MAG: VWA domain-containing protein [Pirellulaceae bacterium]
MLSHSHFDNSTRLCEHSSGATRKLPVSGRRDGAVMVLMVLLLPVVLLMCAFAINMAYVELARTEMVIAADAAARAGGRELAVSRSSVSAMAATKDFAGRNTVGGQPLTLLDSDIELGKATRTGNARYGFNPTTVNPNAIRVTANRSAGSADGALSLLMPNILGTSAVDSTQQAISTAMEVDIALVIDRSGSMAFAANETADPYVPPASAPPGWNFCDEAPPICRWRNVVAAVDVFLNEVNSSPANELVAMVTYSGSAITNQSLTNNTGDVLSSLQPYTDSFCAGATNIGGGINEGAAALQLSPNARDGAGKVIVVMTDGIHNTGANPVSAATSATAGGAMIFTITFSNEANQSDMQTVANTGQGEHYHATSPADLIAAFQDIAKKLPTLLTQ